MLERGREKITPHPMAFHVVRVLRSTVQKAEIWGCDYAFGSQLMRLQGENDAELPVIMGLKHHLGSSRTSINAQGVATCCFDELPPHPHQNPSEDPHASTQWLAIQPQRMKRKVEEYELFRCICSSSRDEIVSPFVVSTKNTIQPGGEELLSCYHAHMLRGTVWQSARRWA